MYKAMAKRTAEGKRRDIDEEDEHLAARAQLHRSNMYAERLKDAEKCRMTNARFADEDLEAMAVSWSSGAFGREKVAALRDAAVVPPLIPSPEVRARLGEVAVVEEPRQVLAPWCVEICKHRESFTETVLVIEGEMPTAYLFLFAMQSPYFAAFAQVVRLGGVVPSSSGALALRRAAGELSPHAYDHCFCIDWNTTVTGLDIVCENLASAYVVSDVVAFGSDILASNARAVPFDEFLSSLPSKPASDGKAAAPRAPAIPIEGLPKYGWLDKYTGHGSDDGVGARPPGSSGDPVPLVGAPLDDDEAEQVFIELDEMRRSWHGPLEDGAFSFKTSIMGGKWTKEHVGMVADAFRGYAATGDAKAWCVMYHLQNAMRFNISAYGEKTANALALHWARRMEYFYNVWYAQALPNYRFTAADFEAMPFTEVLADALEHVPIEDATWDAYRKVENMRPGAPGGHGPAAGSGDPMPAAAP